MLVREAIQRIRFNTSTLDDLSGRAVNTLFNDQNIAYQLNTALDKYASETQGIQGLYTFPLETTSESFDAPPLALKTKVYRWLHVRVSGVLYPVDVTNLNTAITNFRYEWSGIPRWVVPWQDVINIYPSIASSNYYYTTLSQAINKTDTTLLLDDASGLLLRNGRISIGTEKIKYGYQENNYLYNCERGVEDTTAQNHAIGDTVKENNFWVFYYKKNFKITVEGPERISKTVLDKELEVCDEHMEVITDYTSYKLLSKIDPKRGEFYKVNFDEWLLSAKAELRRGYRMTNSAGNIRYPYWSESANAGIYLV